MSVKAPQITGNLIICSTTKKTGLVAVDFQHKKATNVGQTTTFLTPFHQHSCSILTRLNTWLPSHMLRQVFKGTNVFKKFACNMFNKGVFSTVLEGTFHNYQNTELHS